MVKLPEINRPIAYGVMFFTLCIYFTYYFGPSLQYLGIASSFASSELGLFISSPFNLVTDGSLVYNLFLPVGVIMFLGFYLRNINITFQKKCSLAEIFWLSVIASYLKSVVSMFVYRGYADYGISLGSSVITISFIAAFLISLEVYLIGKERYEHLYGHFMFTVMSSLVVLLAVLTGMSFFLTTSALVHLIGLVAFLLMFIPVYEHDNIVRFIEREKKAMRRHRRHAAVA